MGIKKICANLLNQRYQCSYHCKWAAKKSVQICSISVISVPIIVNGQQKNLCKSAQSALSVFLS
ncbi:MAG: hypothetical protein QM541_04780, partial [Flavobacterium sp.]|nr:hypothetical protein [Flavobacterium sp.]